MHLHIVNSFAMVLALIFLVSLWNLEKNTRQNTMRQRKRTYDKPVVCICQVNDRVGVVLRSDSNKASHDFWKPHITGKIRYDHGSAAAWRGRYMNVKPVFVFRPDSNEYANLLNGCYVERATFEVPHQSGDERAKFLEAFKYFHGFPFEETNAK
jgi:hypothetical protein